MSSGEVEKSSKAVFTGFQASIEDEQRIRDNIRESTKELDKYSKQIQSILQGIHQSGDLKDFCVKSREILDNDVKTQFQLLEAKIPKGEYYYFHDMWRHLMQRLAGSCALIHYLETEELGDQVTLAGMVGLKTSAKEASIYLDLEDYLQGVLQMASELARFTVNCVTHGDYARPAKIGKFVAELNEGFRELNLKNDYLRKRFDGLKYDIKKIEEVIYDVSIRGLSTPSVNPNPAEGQ